MALIDKITSQLKGYFGGVTRNAKEKVDDLGSFFNRFSRNNEGGNVPDPKTETKLLSPIPEREIIGNKQNAAPLVKQVQASETSPTRQRVTQQQIEAGLNRFKQPAPPIATLSAQLAEAGNRLPANADPLLPTILALMESRGLLDPKPAAASNPYNIMAPNLVDYQDPSVAILGNDQKLGLSGLLRQGGLYQDYLDSGDLSLFFNRFTPSSDPLNPSNNELIQRYNTLSELFQ